MDTTPHVFINASAVGFYGMSNSVIYTEDTNTPANDFLADVVAKWEKAALSAEDLGMRTVRKRFGIFLDKNNGDLSMMDIPFIGFIGGWIGNGGQCMYCVYIDDVYVLMYIYL